MESQEPKPEMSVMAAQNGSHLYTLMEEEPSTP